MKNKARVLNALKKLNIYIKWSDVKAIEWDHYYKIDYLNNTYFVLLKDVLFNTIQQYDIEYKINKMFYNYTFPFISNKGILLNKDEYVKELYDILPWYFTTQGGKILLENTNIMIVQFPLLNEIGITKRSMDLINRLNEQYKNTNLCNVYIKNYFYEFRNTIYYLGIISHEIFPFVMYNSFEIINDTLYIYRSKYFNSIDYLNKYNLLDKFIKSTFENENIHKIKYL